MTTATATTRPARSVGFGATLASEWTKLLSLRSTKITVVLGVLVAIGMTSLLSAVVGSTMSGWPPEQQAQFNPTEFSLFGTIFSAIFFTVLGVNIVASEYSTGMIRLTFTVTPKRTRVLVAKLMLVTAVTLVAGTIATFGMYFAAQAVFEYYGLTPAALSDPDTQRVLVMVSLLGPVWPVIGATTAVLTRSAAASIASVMAMIFAPAMFGGLLPRRWQEDVLAYLPGPLTDSLSLPSTTASPMHLDAPIAAAALAAWLVLFIFAAWVVLTRRDA